MLNPLLFAIDLDTILQVGVFLFIIISTLAGQLFSKNQRGPAKGQKPRPRPRQRPERPDDLGQNRPERQPQAQPWNEPIEVRMPRERDVVRAEPVRPELVRAETVPVEPVVVRESVAEHVQRHIESGGIESRLQSQVEQADERMASHLQDAFDHRLGRLESEDDAKIRGTKLAKKKSATSTTESPPVATSEIAARVAQMMRNPDDLSAAIVLNEILKRPEDRWNE